MSHILSSTANAKGSTIEVVRRVKCVHIETPLSGSVRIVAEQEDVTMVDGVVVGAPQNTEPLILTDTDVKADPGYESARAAMVLALNAKREAILEKEDIVIE
jgi:hypothetical protein